MNQLIYFCMLHRLLDIMIVTKFYCEVIYFLRFYWVRKICRSTTVNIMLFTDNGVTRGWNDGFILFLFPSASILLRSVNPCLLQGKMCDRGGIELLQSKNENGWRSLDWHQQHRISFSGCGPSVFTWLDTNSGRGIGTLHWKCKSGDDLTTSRLFRFS